MSLASGHAEASAAKRLRSSRHVGHLTHLREMGVNRQLDLALANYRIVRLPSSLSGSRFYALLTGYCQIDAGG